MFCRREAKDWEIKAHDFAMMAHEGQLDDMGRDYFEAHILQVVNIMKLTTSSPLILTVAYLHDTIEDTDVTYEELCLKFNETVADWVMELTHEGKKDGYGYYFPRLKTKECIQIKFADRLSNLSRMYAWKENRQQHYLRRSKFWKDGSDLVRCDICGEVIDDYGDDVGICSYNTVTKVEKNYHTECYEKRSDEDEKKS